VGFETVVLVGSGGVDDGGADVGGGVVGEIISRQPASHTAIEPKPNFTKARLVKDGPDSFVLVCFSVIAVS
jgi:hypothetical protein